MNEEFINVYIENLANKLTDLVKNEVLLATHLQLHQKRIVDLEAEIVKLRSENEKLNKKAGKKEVNTSPDTF